MWSNLLGLPSKDKVLKLGIREMHFSCSAWLPFKYRPTGFQIPFQKLAGVVEASQTRMSMGKNEPPVHRCTCLKLCMYVWSVYIYIYIYVYIYILVTPPHGPTLLKNSLVFAVFLPCLHLWGKQQPQTYPVNHESRASVPFLF